MKKMYLGSFLIIGAVLVWYFLFPVIFNNSKEKYEKEKRVQINCVVDTIVQDPINLSVSSIKFTNGTSFMPSFTYGIWMDVNPGDSLVKETGSFLYVIYRNSKIDHIDSIAYTIDTNTWAYQTSTNMPKPRNSNVKIEN